MKSIAAYVDSILLFSFVALLGLGIVMVFSSSSVLSIENYGDEFHFLKLQLIWCALGSLMVVALLLVDYRLLRPWATAGLVGTILLLVATYIPGIGHTVKGASRWIDFFGLFRIQPAEIAKFTVALYFADRAARMHRQRESFRKFLLPMLLILLAVGGLIVQQPNLSTSIIVVSIGFSILFVSYGRLGQLLFLGLAGVGGIGAFIYLEPYRLRRWQAFLDPFEDPYGTGYHIIQSLVAMGSGGWMGVGIGQSHQKFQYLPEVYSDFIFAIIGEEMGFVGTSLVLVLLSTLVWRGLRTALRAPDLYGMLLALGLTGGIALQAALNIAVATGVAPPTGITLPLISYGGSSLLFTMISMGVLLNISLVGEKERLVNVTSRLVRFEGLGSSRSI